MRVICVAYFDILYPHCVYNDHIFMSQREREREDNFLSRIYREVYFRIIKYERYFYIIA